MKSTPSSSAPSMKLPDHLDAQILAFEKRLRRFETIYTVCGALAGLIAAFGLLFLSDRFWDTPMFLRLVFTLGGMVAAGAFTLYWMRRWGWAHRSRRELAVLIQRRHRKLGDRLQGVVELAENPSDAFSPALVRAAIAQVGKEVEAYDFAEAVETRRPRRWMIAATVLLVLVGLPFAIFPKAGRNALQRWINPFRSVERFTFVRMEDLPAALVVAHGEPFEIACRLRSDSESFPEVGYARFPDQPRVTARVVEREAVFKLPGQTSRAPLTIRMGDASRVVEVVPTHRPALVGLRATITLPEYLKHAVVEQEVHSQTLTVVEGSRVRLQAESSRAPSVVDQGSGGEIEIEGKFLRTQDLPADTTEEISFTWKDGDHLETTAPVKLALETIPDEPPRVDGRNAPRSTAILEDELARIPLLASDDFGVRSFRLNWRAEHQASRDDPPSEIATRSVILGKGAPDATSLQGEFVFSPIAEQVPEGSTVYVKAQTTDYKPGRVPSESPEFQIYVLSRLDHANMIKERMEVLMTQIEEVARAEEELMQENQSLALHNDERLADSASQEQLKANAQEEARNKQTVKNLAEVARNIMKDALRNKDVSEKTIQDLNTVADTLDETAASEMSSAQQSLQSAASSSQDRQQKTSDAAEQEKKAVETLREMEKKMNQGIENMMALSFVNRLRKAASEQDAVGTSLKNMLADVLGLETNLLNQVQTRNVAGLGDRHKANQKQAGYVQDDLAGFYNRTRKEVYNKIAEEMAEERMRERMDALTHLIEANIVARSTQGTVFWRDKFNAWADLLEDEAMENSDSQEGQEGEAEEVDMDVLIALMRARVREENLREQTRTADEVRTETPDAYAPTTRKLTESQLELASDMDRLEKKIRSDKLKQLVTVVSGEMMNAGTRLNLPDTGSETIAIQTEIIELLAQLIQQSKSSKSSRSMMAAMGMGVAPGFGTGLYDSSLAGAGGEGAGAGKAADDRTVNPSSGIHPAEFPEEFREVLESYYQGMEAL